MQGFLSSNSTRVTIKRQLVRKATGDHLIKSTSLVKKLRALSLISDKLKIEYATQFKYVVVVSYANTLHRTQILENLSVMRHKMTSYYEKGPVH